jgi:N-acetylglucosaminyldiphosphoundecaprenol N-acetyl-beta-D-mannosaminyltransferase
VTTAAAPPAQGPDHPSGSRPSTGSGLGRTGDGFPARYPVAGVLISDTTYADATRSILAAAQTGQSTLVAATSVHGLVTAVRDAEFRRVLNSFDMLTPDGQPVRWGLNLLARRQLAERVYGPTLMLEVCREAARHGIGVYLYGGKPAVLEQLVERLPQLAPGLRVAGYQSPPFRELTAEEDAASVGDILDSGAGIVLVALGCPSQERWAFAHRDRLPLAVVCVGAAFDFHAGTLRQAPPWMQSRGLEWLFRLLMEPSRLWRRYVSIVPFYLYVLGREYLRQRVKGHTPSS